MAAQRVSWLLGVALLAGGTWSCEKKEAQVTKKVVYKGPISETTNVLTLLSDSAKLQIRLTAPVEETFESGDQIYPKGVKVSFYGDGGSRVINTLEGKYAKYDKAKNLYLVRGDVRVANQEKQQKMNTEELFYDRVKAIIYTKPETAVRVETLTEVLTGNGLTANQDFSLYSILNPTGVFTLSEAPPVNAK
ncbi:LPS export ABC transporter periplasmic protein LptC [Hymenobacter cellulosivorans]|uniref:LPS export ABC transporter periplasmic protein LptC n=1 Tax=Hymenobacter cellulosivorans TaxID=2932249 RepID=A0ABY4FDS7_9BACT|nr:LPS export ABC transporter periplasmic protein LptC [Hymenobacter cellulosivorans]UOQ54168.1 LPS export ABC transporter periplasmic protein LptC [Hymenobacter cellulosivorans]